MDELHEAHLERILENRRRRGVVGVYNNGRMRSSSATQTDPLPIRSQDTHGVDAGTETSPLAAPPASGAPGSRSAFPEQQKNSRFSDAPSASTFGRRDAPAAQQDQRNATRSRSGSEDDRLGYPHYTGGAAYPDNNSSKSNNRDAPSRFGGDDSRSRVYSDRPDSRSFGGRGSSGASKEPTAREGGFSKGNDRNDDGGYRYGNRGGDNEPNVRSPLKYGSKTNRDGRSSENRNSGPQPSKMITYGGKSSSPTSPEKYSSNRTRDQPTSPATGNWRNELAKSHSPYGGNRDRSDSNKRLDSGKNSGGDDSFQPRSRNVANNQNRNVQSSDGFNSSKGGSYNATKDRSAVTSPGRKVPRLTYGAADSGSHQQHNRSRSVPVDSEQRGERSFRPTSARRGKSNNVGSDWHSVPKQTGSWGDSSRNYDRPQENIGSFNSPQRSSYPPTPGTMSPMGNVGGANPHNISGVPPSEASGMRASNSPFRPNTSGPVPLGPDGFHSFPYSQQGKPAGSIVYAPNDSRSQPQYPQYPQPNSVPTQRDPSYGSPSTLNHSGGMRGMPPPPPMEHPYPYAQSAPRGNQSAMQLQGLPDTRTTLDLASSATVLATGDWFYKWNSKGTRVSRRWLWVDPQSYLLAWSRKETYDTAFAGSMKLEKIQQIIPKQMEEVDDNGMPRHFFALQIVNHKRVLQLATELRHKADTWYEAFTNVVTFCRQSDGSPLPVLSNE